MISYHSFIYKKWNFGSFIIIINTIMGRPRSWTVYFTFNGSGEIYQVFHSMDKLEETSDIRKYKSGLSEHESKILVKIMRNYYKIGSAHIELNEIPNKLKYLKFPPKSHKSRLTPSWNKGLTTDKKYKTSSTKANQKVANKKDIWLLNTFAQKACSYCYEGEISCLSYHPDMKEIKRINTYLGLNQSREALLKTIEIQKIVCLNCSKKLDMGLELV